MLHRLAPLLAIVSLPHTQALAATEAQGQICWALATSEQPTAEVAARITDERCLRGDPLVVLGLTREPLGIAAAFCDLTHPVTVHDRMENGRPVHARLCLHSGQRRVGRNGQERPRGH